jgi:hypothetical protein
MKDKKVATAFVTEKSIVFEESWLKPRGPGFEESAKKNALANIQRGIDSVKK